MVSVKKVYKILGFPFFETERKYEETSSPQKTTTSVDSSSLRIAFYNGGGMGDSIIDVAFIQNLRKILPADTIIDYYAKSGKVFRYCPFISNVYSETKQLDTKKYDLALGNHRFWMVSRFNENKVKRLAPVLYEFVKYQLNLRNNILRNNNDNNNLYSQYAMLLGKNRWEQVDLKEITGFNRNNTLYMPLSPEYFSILSRYQLEPKKYITINRGVDSNLGENCPKLWPLEHYKKLIQLLHKQYPSLKILQIGANDKYGVINADLNLLGKTDIEETKILLKNALIHIDVEGGLVHLNHILHGKSCVIFGPTPLIPLKYDENINLKNKACPHFCDWVIQDWQKECLRGINPPPCMTETSPEKVINALSAYIDNYKPYHWHSVSNDLLKAAKNDELYLVGNFEDSFLDDISAKYQVISLCNKLTAETAKFHYADLYNMPFSDNMLSNIIWKPQTDSLYQTMCFAELLRVLKPGGKMTVLVQYLNDEMHAKLQIRNLKTNSKYFTIMKG